MSFTKQEYIPMKILALGDSGVGKTCLLNRYSKQVFNSEFVSTVGIDFKEKRFVYEYHKSGHTHEVFQQGLHLQLWDTAGQERFRSLTSAFFRDAMGFLLTFDLTNLTSFTNLTNWLKQIEAHAYSDNPALVLIGTKVDLKEQREVDDDVIKEFSESLGGVKYHETSSLSGERVNEAVGSLIQIILEQMNVALGTWKGSDMTSDVTSYTGIVKTLHELDEMHLALENGKRGTCAC